MSEAALGPQEQQESESTIPAGPVQAPPDSQDASENVVLIQGKEQEPPTPTSPLLPSSSPGLSSSAAPTISSTDDIFLSRSLAPDFPLPSPRLIVHILRFLSRNEILNLSVVSRDWRSICTSDAVWVPESAYLFRRRHTVTSGVFAAYVQSRGDASEVLKAPSQKRTCRTLDAILCAAYVLVALVVTISVFSILCGSAATNWRVLLGVLLGLGSLWAVASLSYFGSNWAMFCFLSKDWRAVRERVSLRYRLGSRPIEALMQARKSLGERHMRGEIASVACVGLLMLFVCVGPLVAFGLCLRGVVLGASGGKSSYATVSLLGVIGVFPVGFCVCSLVACIRVALRVHSLEKGGKSYFFCVLLPGFVMVLTGIFVAIQVLVAGLKLDGVVKSEWPLVFLPTFLFLGIAVCCGGCGVMCWIGCSSCCYGKKKKQAEKEALEDATPEDDDGGVVPFPSRLSYMTGGLTCSPKCAAWTLLVVSLISLIALLLVGFAVSLPILLQSGSNPLYSLVPLFVLVTLLAVLLFPIFVCEVHHRLYRGMGIWDRIRDEYFSNEQGEYGAME